MNNLHIFQGYLFTIVIVQNRKEEIIHFDLFFFKEIIVSILYKLQKPILISEASGNFLKYYWMGKDDRKGVQGLHFIDLSCSEDFLIHGYVGLLLH